MTIFRSQHHIAAIINEATQHQLDEKVCTVRNRGGDGLYDCLDHDGKRLFYISIADENSKIYLTGDKISAIDLERIAQQVQKLFEDISITIH